LRLDQNQTDVQARRGCLRRPSRASPNESQICDGGLTKWVTPTVNVLHSFSETIGQGGGLVNTKKSTCFLAPLSYLCKHAHGQSHSLPYHTWFGHFSIILLSSCPSPPMAPSPSCSSFVPSCNSSSRRHGHRITSLKRARST
jgi:hypothetical protein